MAGIIQRDGASLYDQDTGLLIGYINPLTGREEDMPASTTSASSTSSTQQVISDLLTQWSGVALRAPPARTAAYKITGTTYYVDPGVTGPGSGSYGDPFKTLPAAQLTAGQGFLFRRGTTTVLSSAYTLTTTGTSNAPSVFGVYDPDCPTADKRVYGTVGAATVSGGASAIDLIVLASVNYVCVDGLAFTNNGTTKIAVSVVGTNASNQVLNCSFSGNGKHISVVSNGGGHVIECNYSLNSGSEAIYVQVNANDSTTKINYNTVKGAATRSLMVHDNFADKSFSGEIACNVVRDSPAVTGNPSGIYLLTTGGAPQIFRNTVYKCNYGISVVSSKAYTAEGSSFSGLLIQNNDVRNCEMNVSLSGTWGPWVMERNTLMDAGSWSGTSGDITSDHYGRNVELFGANDSTGVTNGVIRYNYCSGAYNWNNSIAAPGSEGCGIGIDDRSNNIDVYGNYVIDNEGTGIQLNRGYNVRVFGNVCIDNCKPRAGNTVVVLDNCASEIACIVTPFAQVYNNTCLQYGRTYQKYGITDTAGQTAPGVVNKNNLLIGASVAGMGLLAGTSESYNKVIGAPNIAVNVDTGAVRAAGTGTASTTSSAVQDDALLPYIVAGGSCDGAGTYIGAWVLLMNGQPQPASVPVGALLP